jgi:chromosome segregation ATPase
MITNYEYNESGLLSKITNIKGSASAAIADANQKIDDKNGKITILNKDKKDLEDQIKYLNKCLAELNHKIEGLEGQLKTSQDNLAAKTKELNDTKAELATTQANLTAKTTELNNTKTELANTQAELAEAEKTIVNLTGDKQNLEDENARLEGEVNAANNKVEELRQSAEAAKAKVADKAPLTKEESDAVDTNIPAVEDDSEE